MKCWLSQRFWLITPLRDRQVATIPQIPVRCGSSAYFYIDTRYSLFFRNRIPLCQARSAFNCPIREGVGPKIGVRDFPDVNEVKHPKKNNTFSL
jgi:hypothetical protein